MDLASEIETVKRAVVTDAYQMSLGEIVSLYTEGDLIVNPAFQRLFRWNLSQKSRFIESLLLGIPVPSIFVFEMTDGKWELIDGLQRVSTVLEFMGLLDPERTGQPVSPSCLDATTYLPSLHNAVWEIADSIVDVPTEEQVPIGRVQQLAIRRARLGVEILKRPSDPQTKYDLFQRLNSGGTIASPQELRNCVVVMVDATAIDRIEMIAADGNFISLNTISEEQKISQRHMEYAMRFLVYRYVPYDGKLDVEEYVDQGIVQILQNGGLTEEVFSNFRDTFALIVQSVGADGFKRFIDGAFRGRTGLTALETIGVGVSTNLDRIRGLPDPQGFLSDKIRTMWQQEIVQRFGRAGLRGTQRIQRTLPFGTSWFRPD